MAPQFGLPQLGLTTGLGAGVVGGAAVPTSISSISLPTSILSNVPALSSSTVVVPVPVVSGVKAPGVAIPSISGVAAPGLPSVGANNLPVASIQAITALPDFPGLSNLPTGTALSFTVPTTVPVASSSVLSSLAALPINSGLPGIAGVLEAISALPVDLPTGVPSLPTGLAGNLPVSELPTSILAGLPTGIPGNLPISAPIGQLPTGVLNGLPSGLPTDLPISGLVTALPIASLPPLTLPSDLPITSLVGNVDVLSSLTDLGESIVTQLSEALGQILDLISQAAAGAASGQVPSTLPAVPTLNLSSVSPVKRAAEAEAKPQGLGGATNLLGGLTGGVTGGSSSPLSAVTGLTGGLTGGSSNPLSAVTGVTGGLTGGSSSPLSAVSGPTGGLTGGSSNPLSAITGGLSGSANPLSSVTGALGGSGNPLSLLTGAVSGGSSPLSSVTGLLGGSGSPLNTVTGLLGGGSSPLTAVTGALGQQGLSGVTAGLTTLNGVASTIDGGVAGLTGALDGATANLPNPTGPITAALGLGAGTPLNIFTPNGLWLGLGSFVLNAVKTLPIPTNINSFLGALQQAAIAPLSSIVPAAQLAQVNNILSLLSYSGALSSATTAVNLVALTDLPAVQVAIRSLDAPSLITVVNALQDRNIVGAGGVGALLSNPAAFLNVVKSIVPLVSNPSPAVAFLILEQLNVADLPGLVTSGLSAGAATGVLSGITGGLSLGGVTSVTSGLSG